MGIRTILQSTIHYQLLTGLQEVLLLPGRGFSTVLCSSSEASCSTGNGPWVLEQALAWGPHREPSWQLGENPEGDHSLHSLSLPVRAVSTGPLQKHAPACFPWQAPLPSRPWEDKGWRMEPFGQGHKSSHARKQGTWEELLVSLSLYLFPLGPPRIDIVFPKMFCPKDAHTKWAAYLRFESLFKSGQATVSNMDSTWKMRS